MGVCNSLENCKTLKFKFEGDFVKKHISKKVPNGMAVKDLFKYFYNNTQKSSKDQIFAVKVKNRVLTANTQVLVSDLDLAPNEKLAVFLIPKNKTQVSVQIESFCCDVKQDVVQVGQKMTLDGVKELALKSRNCCKRQIKYVAVNQFVIDANSHLSLKKNDKIVVVFEGCNERNVKNRWKFIGSGVNRKGICFNHECFAYKQEVIDIKGFGEFNLDTPNDDVHCCPVCKGEIKAKPNVLLHNCILHLFNADDPVKIGQIAYELHNEKNFKVCFNC